MSKQVIHAQLHEGFFIPGMPTGGNFKQTLPPADKTLKNFKMNLQENGSLLVEFEDAGYLKSFSVASANIRIAVFAPEKLKANDKKNS